ncbi:hypothetical protein HXX76_005012 [Chlamydomonas incerta]|uniref:Uncharacterized protein n=1 Tax=Chlamydomonas incerta TaxID=51695 RepID=A0A835W3Y0_CHLIN|nr:hypothetical protein HXX76_005012 [Chlamydomonas incerta]|eukprot:KAG2439662.1 hypothetical protein HXX76_005012 [Chlamydomonas incerta]
MQSIAKHGTNQRRATFHRAGGAPARGLRAARPCTVAVAAAATVTKLETGAWVVAPQYRSKGVVHFLGGAFAGAAPQVVYSLLLDSIADAGYTAIATPYAVTFRHDDCARSVRQQFLDSVAELRGAAGLPDAAPDGVPVIGMGHSNGALLHLLIGSFFPGAAATNIVISFNNKQVKDAIPVPGLMENLPGAVNAVRNNLPLPDLASLQLPIPLPTQLPTGSQVLGVMASLLPPELRGAADRAGQLSGAGLLLDQIPSVFGEVGGGATDFYPTPAESRVIIGGSYGVSPTLVVRFADDSIDESLEMSALLKSRLGAGVTQITLPGTHITPCGGDVPWPTGPIFTPMDTIAQVVKEQQQADILRLSKQLVGWMDMVSMQQV